MTDDATGYSGPEKEEVTRVDSWEIVDYVGFQGQVMGQLMVNEEVRAIIYFNDEEERSWLATKVRGDRTVKPKRKGK